jgi:hypothetical protein
MAPKEKRSFLKQLNRRSGQEHAEIKALSETIASGAPERHGTNPMQSVEAAPAGSYAGARLFEELPISTYTKVGGDTCKHASKCRRRLHGA